MEGLEHQEEVAVAGWGVLVWDRVENVFVQIVAQKFLIKEVFLVMNIAVLNVASR